MLPKTSRLPSSEFRAGGYKTVRTPYFLLKIKRTTRVTSRIAAIVSASAIKSAVRRNFWKRQAKSMLSLALGKPADVLIIFSKEVATLTKAQFKKEFIKAYSSL